MPDAEVANLLVIGVSNYVFFGPPYIGNLLDAMAKQAYKAISSVKRWAVVWHNDIGIGIEIEILVIGHYFTGDFFAKSLRTNRPRNSELPGAGVLAGML